MKQRLDEIESRGKAKISALKNIFKKLSSSVILGSENYKQLLFRTTKTTAFTELMVYQKIYFILLRLGFH